MKITAEQVRDLRDRAKTCISVMQDVVRWVDDPVFFTGGPFSERDHLALSARLIIGRQGEVRAAAADFPGRTEILELINVCGGGSFDEWSVGKLKASTAHAWALLCGDVFGQWSGRLRIDDEDASDGQRQLWAKMPNGTFVVIDVNDQDFRSRLETAGDMIDLEYRRTAKEVMLKGGNVVTDDSNTADGEDPDKGDATPKDDNATKAKLPRPSALLAWQSYERAEAGLTMSGSTNVTDKAAYMWLKEHDPEEYKLPDRETWGRYVREVRSALGRQKNQPRKGRTGRSIVRHDEL